MTTQLPLETPPTDHRPELVTAYRAQLVEKGVESNLAAEAAFILVYRDIMSRTVVEQQTLDLAFSDIYLRAQANG